MGVLEALGAGAARLLFYPSLLYTVTRARLPGSRRPWFHRIDEVVLLGALPLRGCIRRLLAEENVRGVVTLTEDYETRFLCFSPQEWEAMGVEQLRLSTVDLTGVPTLENLHKGVEFILRHRARAASLEPSGSNRGYYQDSSPYPHSTQASPGPGEISQEHDQ
ncbi:PREDICTED: phosphatidylglycerophosphatase and protein-tyrosine phosphatase 1 isoform X2 [Pseudopodoces humilis]|uniref:phosphatidylglycerophosphatase and protein-tyrosine phosphatase 1 isoform X2 n=1 Tax=Pseudopodoces humilis TaxID=181119 RepID=UPI0006B787A9|nr:PREDICTED: phosphatidylglycerophosphatase and protein-tyrosine phosphatase 1 isoform X2 [Pseudopodoces humilis]